MSQPKQARSVASMNRMLDAAESLLEQGGPDALTVDAVVATAATSVGSFYARFGDRQGLLVAMQDRFLSRLGAVLAPTFARDTGDENLATTTTRIVAGYLGAFRQNRPAFVAYMLLNRSDATMRTRGAEANRAAASAIARALQPHRAEIGHDDLALAGDMVHRSLFAMATQVVMFDADEVGGTPRSDAAVDAHVAEMLVAYLRREESDQAVDPG